MAGDHLLQFDNLHLDLANECIWCGEQVIRLTPKAFALLRYLAERPGQLVTKDELLKAVWPEAIVSEGVLTTHIGVLRQVLGDNAKAPQYIETVHRRGYRFIGQVASSQYSVDSIPLLLSTQDFSTPTSNPQHPAPVLVGREAELTQLHSLLDKALRGERQLAFVTGEAGIGKTTAVEAFLAAVALSQEIWLGLGQCIEQFGPGEAYLPLLAAIGQLCREPGHEQVLTVLHQYAPTWLVQLPALVSPADFEGLQRRTSGATRERMLREMAEALEALTAVKPLVLVLEDLYWSDPSTLELLSFIARRRQAAHLLVIGTYRTVEVLANGHPLRAVTQELQLHQHCEELPLRLLGEDDIAQYLTISRVAKEQQVAPVSELARLIHQRTEGNPLFMVNIVEDLLVRGTLENPEIVISTPATIQQLIERQFDHLSPADQRVLEAASVAGIEFSAAVVAAGVEANVSEIETCCAALTRREQFLRLSGSDTWPDGTLAARYRFQHALYQAVVYKRVTVNRRSDLHRRIGERLEAAYQERAGEIAAELAVHFEQGRDYMRAVQYRQQAGQRASQHSANTEAISHLTKGLTLLETLPDTSERAQQELALQLALGSALMATKGFVDPKVERTYARARELCQRVGDTLQLVQALWGLTTFYGLKGDAKEATELAEQLLALAQSKQNPTALILAGRLWGSGSYWRGEFVSALEHVEKVRLLSDRHTPVILPLYDSGVHCRGYAAGALWKLGYPEQALKRLLEALSLARELSHPNSMAYALAWSIPIHKLRGEVQAVHEQGGALIKLCTAQGLPYFLGSGTIGLGWALVERGQEEEGLAQIRQGLTANRALGANPEETYWLVLLAEACGRIGQTEEGLAAIVKALSLVDKGIRAFEAELYRLKGELTLQQENQKSKGKNQKLTLLNPQPLPPSTQAEVAAEACFRKAIEVAQSQQAKSWELRATTSLARLWQQQALGQSAKSKAARTGITEETSRNTNHATRDRLAEAHRMLSKVYNWFTEGFDTKDLQEAKALLEKLSH